MPRQHVRVCGGRGVEASVAHAKELGTGVAAEGSPFPSCLPTPATRACTPASWIRE